MARSDPAGDRLSEMLVNKPTRMHIPKIAEPDAARPSQPLPQVKTESELDPHPLKARHPVFEMVCSTVRRSGFTHPEAGNFVMLPREFEAILALETKAVVQVVYMIIRETIGWADEHGRHGRREWAQLSHKHFEVVCGSKSQGDSGVKKALQKGYIIRRPHGNSYEYSLRWREPDKKTDF